MKSWMATACLPQAAARGGDGISSNAPGSDSAASRRALWRGALVALVFFDFELALIAGTRRDWQRFHAPAIREC